MTGVQTCALPICAYTVSVKLGASETILRTGCGIRTVRPTSSVNSRDAGAALPCERACKEIANEAATNSTASAARNNRFSFLRTPSFILYPTEIRKSLFSCKNKKALRDPVGLIAILLLARSFAIRSREGSLAYGFSADYSGGTAAESHGLPRFPCLQTGHSNLPAGVKCGSLSLSSEPHAVKPSYLPYLRPQNNAHAEIATIQVIVHSR